MGKEARSANPLQMPLRDYPERVRHYLGRLRVLPRPKVNRLFHGSATDAKCLRADPIMRRVVMVVGMGVGVVAVAMMVVVAVVVGVVFTSALAPALMSALRSFVVAAVFSSSCSNKACCLTIIAIPRYQTLSTLAAISISVHIFECFYLFLFCFSLSHKNYFYKYHFFFTPSDAPVLSPFFFFSFSFPNEQGVSWP